MHKPVDSRGVLRLVPTTPSTPPTPPRPQPFDHRNCRPGTCDECDVAGAFDERVALEGKAPALETVAEAQARVPPYRKLAVPFRFFDPTIDAEPTLDEQRAAGERAPFYDLGAAALVGFEVGDVAITEDDALADHVAGRMPVAFDLSPLGREAAQLLVGPGQRAFDWTSIEPDARLQAIEERCTFCGEDLGDHVSPDYDPRRPCERRACGGFQSASSPAPAFPARLSFEFETGEWAEEFFDACDAGGVGRSHRVVDVEVRSALEADQARDVAARMHGREVGKAGA